MLQTKLETTANVSAKTQPSRLYHTVDIDISKLSRVGCELAPHPMAKFGRIGILEEDNVKPSNDGLCEKKVRPEKNGSSTPLAKRNTEGGAKPSGGCGAKLSDGEHTGIERSEEAISKKREVCLM